MKVIRTYAVLILLVSMFSVSLSGCQDEPKGTVLPDNGAAQPDNGAAGGSNAAPVVTTATWTLAKGWQMPVQVPAGATQSDWYDMGWETFIALNWPAKWSSWPRGASQRRGTRRGIGGRPDRRASITSAGSAYPAVWQTYLAPEQVFLAKGADPGKWARPKSALRTKVDPVTGKFLPVLGGFSKGVASSGEKSGEFNEASGQPLIAQDGNYVSFEMRMNQSEFAYLRHHKYYDAVSQKAATANGGTIEPFPKTGTESFLDLPAWAQQGATEIKAAWRIVSNTKFASRYFTMKAFRELPDGTVDGPHLFGLVGFHILRLTPTSGSTWFWATFEQVDNVQIDQSPVPAGLTPSFNPGKASPYPTYPKGFQYNGTTTPPPAVTAGQPLPDLNPVDTSFIDNAIQGGAVTSNRKYQAMLKGSAWQYYQMVGVLNPAAKGGKYEVKPFDNPTNGDQMVNTTMETYSQGTAANPKSCFSCHAFGVPLGAQTKGGYPVQPGNQIFTFLLDDAQSSR